MQSRYHYEFFHMFNISERMFSFDLSSFLNIICILLRWSHRKLIHNSEPIHCEFLINNGAKIYALESGLLKKIKLFQALFMIMYYIFLSN